MLPKVSDPLEWALSLPVSSKSNSQYGESDTPVVPERAGWTLNVFRNNGWWKVTGRCGSRVVIEPKLTFDQVESFDPNKGWK